MQIGLYITPLYVTKSACHKFCLVNISNIRYNFCFCDSHACLQVSISKLNNFSQQQYCQILTTLRKCIQITIFHLTVKHNITKNVCGPTTNTGRLSAENTDPIIGRSCRRC